MRKLLAVMSVAVLVLASCGEDDEANVDVPLATGGEPAKTSKTPSKTAETDAAEPGATAAPAATGGGTTTTTEVPRPATAPEGEQNPPKDGRYAYALKGKSSNPFNPSGPPQSFDGTQNIDISHKGNVYTAVQTNTEEPGRQTVKSRWLDTRVEMLSFKAETQGGDFSCKFDPPLLIAKFPIKPETYPQQKLRGEGNACDGTLDIQIVRKEAMKDATGKSWSTWNARVKLVIKSGELTLTSDETRWVSPDLGTEVATDFRSDARVGPQRIESQGTTRLRKHP